jgi:beta-glucanase (GH16 family)
MNIATAVSILMMCATLRIAAADSGWSLVWSDEFAQADGSAPASTNWVYETGGNGWGNSELESYTNRRLNSKIQSGNLVIEARQETYTGADNITRNYTSARLKTLGKQSWRYGRIEARMKIPKGQGLWPAFWTMGTDIATAGWPTCGEIDIMENIGKEPRIVHGTAHGPGYSGAGGIGGPYTLPGTAAIGDDFHLFAIEWDTNKVRWLFDNHAYFTLTPAQLPAGKTWVYDKPFFILLNVAVGGSWPGAPDGTTTFPQQLLVDYVRVYARTNAPSASLQIEKNGADLKVLWPGEFPQALLQRALAIGQPWQNEPILGERDAGKFVEPIQPGFYRLAFP